MRISRLFRLSTRPFSQNNKFSQNQLVPTQNKQNEEKDPEVTLLIKSYLSTYPGKQKIVDYIDEVEYYDKNPDLQRNKDLVLELKNEEVTNLFSFILNNLNRTLCDIIFYSFKVLYNESKANNNKIKN
jgi:hypothetical protein